MSIDGISIFKPSGEKSILTRKALVYQLKRYAVGLNEEFVTEEEINNLATSIIKSSIDNMSPSQLDIHMEDCTICKISIHQDFAVMAARMAIGNLQKKTCKLRTFSETIQLMRDNTDPVTKTPAPMVSEADYKFIMENKGPIDEYIKHERDFLLDYFGFSTLYRQSYLTKLGGKDGYIVESPQYLWMREVCGIHRGDELKIIFESYDYVSLLYFTHATPTLFNACRPQPQLASCYLLTMKEDSIPGIYDTLKQTALISQSAGGIGLAASKIRANGSYIRGTGGNSNGIVPMLRNYNNTARYVDQGGGKRKGSFAIYLEPWHADIESFLDLRKNNGLEEERTRDLFTALWTCDLFMERVENDESWTLMCPDRCKYLTTTHGEEFNQLYKKYEAEGKGVRKISARYLFNKIIDSQVETGNPYMTYKDNCNKMSNQQNLGTIECLNLCCEIVQFSSKDEIAVCNLASISLKMFVDVENMVFNFEKLYQVTKIITRNLNKVIDINHYPVIEAENSNFRHRPIGIGVQGLAETFMMLRLPFDDIKACILNVQIFETISHAAYTASNELAKKNGKTYKSYPNSPLANGKFHFELCPASGPYNPKTNSQLVLPAHEKHLGVAPLWDWENLRLEIKTDGVYNSLMVALMPTQSTSQILGNTESFEPIQSNLYTRNTLSGSYVVLSKFLVNDLIRLGLWNHDIKQAIVARNGSVQDIDSIPADIRHLYRTVWEIKQKSIIDMAADRQPFIDQSQSLNLHIPTGSHKQLRSCHLHGWKRKLKTGMYYFRTLPAADAIKFTINSGDTAAASASTKKIVSNACTRENKENCLTCSS